MTPQETTKKIIGSIGRVVHACYNLTNKKEVTDVMDAEVALIFSFLESECLRREALAVEKAGENTSDGYHTFKELYEFRKLYNAAFFNELYTTDLLNGENKYNVHKSKRHSDGEECFGGGWFIVMATLPTGQISNHYELKDWDLFDCATREISDVWDGHTPQDVTKRLTDFLSPTTDTNNQTQ